MGHPFQGNPVMDPLMTMDPKFKDFSLIDL